MRPTSAGASCGPGSAGPKSGIRREPDRHVVQRDGPMPESRSLPTRPRRGARARPERDHRIFRRLYRAAECPADILHAALPTGSCDVVRWWASTSSRRSGTAAPGQYRRTAEAWPAPAGGTGTVGHQSRGPDRWATCPTFEVAVAACPAWRRPISRRSSPSTRPSTRSVPMRSTRSLRAPGSSGSTTASSSTTPSPADRRGLRRRRRAGAPAVERRPTAVGANPARSSGPAACSASRPC